MDIVLPYFVAGFLILVVVALLLMPVARYLLYGWQAKRKDIMDSLDAEGRLAYFKKFAPSTNVASANDAVAAFEQLYDQCYGRKYFFGPAALLVLIGVSEATLVILTVLGLRDYIANPLFDLPIMAIAAICGAYLWVTNDFISRARRLDFAPSDILWGSLRLATAVPLGYAFANLLAEGIGIFVAFAISAFPLDVVQSMLRRLANKRLDLEEKAEQAPDEIIKLQGINTTIVERLRNEDITTISQVAYCDPVQIAMRSNLTFNFITDCMNQALAWVYFEENLKIIRPLGFRGAVEIKHLYEELNDTSEEGKVARATAQAALVKLAEALHQDQAALNFALCEIAEDPYTEFLDRVWA
jgi:hypothetical protein